MTDTFNEELFQIPFETQLPISVPKTNTHDNFVKFMLYNATKTQNQLLFSKLIELQVEDGFWIFNGDLSALLGFTLEQLNKMIPGVLRSSVKGNDLFNIWATLIVMVFYDINGEGDTEFLEAYNSGLNYLILKKVNYNDMQSFIRKVYIDSNVQDTKLPIDNALKLIKLQGSDGLWVLSDELSTIISMSSLEIVSSIPQSIKTMGFLESEMFTLWATTLACRFLKPFVGHELIKKSYDITIESLKQGNIDLEEIMNEPPTEKQNEKLSERVSEKLSEDKKQAQPFSSIPQLMAESGYWPLSEETSKAIGKTIESIYTTIPASFKNQQESDQMSIWTTLLTIDFIKANFVTSEEPWKTCMEKANEFLEYMGVSASKQECPKEAQAVISLQKEDGNWIFNEELCMALKKDVGELYNKMPNQIKKCNMQESDQLDVWATALAIEFLKLFQHNSKEIEKAIEIGVKFMAELPTKIDASLDAINAFK